MPAGEACRAINLVIFGESEMKLRTLILSLVLLFLTTTAAFAGARRETPAGFAGRFYQTYLKLRISGLPDKRQLKILAPFLAGDLHRLFKNAQLVKAKFIKENPVDMKPPWQEGDLLTSLFEGAQSFKIGRVSAGRQYTEVSIRLKYSDGGKPVNWTDRLVLIRSKDGWRVHDIRLDGNWQFKNGDSLRQILSAK